MGNIIEISYSEGKTVPTEKKFESNKYLFSAKMEMDAADCLKDKVADLKKFVKTSLDQNV